jgi:hypothetical protein
MQLSRLYDQIFKTYILHLFNEGTVSGPADISLFNFSSHVVCQVKSKVKLSRYMQWMHMGGEEV